MRSTVRTYINQVAAVDILVNFAWIVPILECFYRWTVILLVSFLSVFYAFRHSPRSSTRSQENACIVAYVHSLNLCMGDLTPDVFDTRRTVAYAVP